MEFIKTWWGKLKSSPLYVKAIIAAVFFFLFYIIFIRKTNGEYDNVTSAEIQQQPIDDTVQNVGTGNTGVGGTITDNSMSTAEKALYDAQLNALNQQNSQLSNQLASSGIKTSPSISDYLTPYVAKVAGNWLNDLVNPNTKTSTPKIVTSNTTSPVNTTANSSNIYGSKGYTDFGSDAYGYANGLIDYGKVTSSNMFGSDTYTGFGSDSYAKSNFGW